MTTMRIKIESCFRAGFQSLLAVGFTLALCTSLTAQEIPADSATVILAETLYTMDGPAIENGMVVVRSGKIVSVGKNVMVPAGATTRKVAVLMPGLVDAYTSIGVAGGEAEMTSEVTPELDVVHAIDWTSRDFDRAAEAGITTVHVLPGSDNVFAGGSCVVKVAGDSSKRIVSEHQGSVVAVCSDPAGGNNSRSPRTAFTFANRPTAWGSSGSFAAS